MVFLGYSFALLMGLTLGVIGGGGSILTVPILVYLLDVPPVQATAYSLLVVGLTALVGAWRYHLKTLIAYKVGAAFALPSIVGVWVARAIILPFMPETIYQSPYIVLNKDAFVMLLFAGLMVAIGAMMRQPHPLHHTDATPPPATRLGWVGFKGLLVGVITGIVGAGGGFLIVPALVFFAHLSMKKAVATSLAIIAVKSLVGFTGDLQTGFQPDLFLTLFFTGFTIVGMLVGVRVAHQASDAHLKTAFSWLVLALGIVILIDQLNRLII